MKSDSTIWPSPTGHRGVFVFDRREWSTCLAGFLRWSDFAGMGPRLPRLKVAA